MSDAATEHAGLLERLLEAAPVERRAILRGQADVDLTVRALADLAERWVITDLERSTRAATMLKEVADESCGGGARARARRSLAQALAYSNRFAESLTLLLEAERLAGGAGDELEAARAKLTTLHPLARLGRLDAAVEAGEAARAVLVRLDEETVAARADINLGVIHRMRDDPEAAIMHFRRAAPQVASEPLTAAQLRSNVAEALLDLHRFHDAEEAFREALALFESQGARRAAAIVAGNIADLLSRQGRFGPALALFERAQTHLTQEEAAGDAARLQAEQADALAAMGAQDAAVAAFTSAIPVLQEQGLAAEAARAEAGLGRALLASGRADEAAVALDHAIERYTEVSNETGADRARFWRALARSAAGDRAEAAVMLTSLIDRFHDRPADRCAVRLALAALLLEEDVAEAGRQADAGVAEARELALSPLLTDGLHTQALVAIEQGRLSDAEALLREAMAQIERSRGALQADRLRLAFAADRHRVYEDAFDVTARIGASDAAQRAFGIAERAKSRGLLDLVQADALQELDRSSGESPLARRVGEQRAALSALYAEFERPETRPGTSETRAAWRRRLADCEQTLTLLETRLAASGEGSDLFATPVEASSLQAMLPPGASVLEYYIARGRIACVVIRREGVDLHADLADCAQVESAIERLNFHIHRAIMRTSAGRSAPDPNPALRELQALGASLLAPLGAAAEAERLWIVPHGLLHTVPFHALRNGADYLMERTTVTTVPSASILAHLAQNGRPATARPGALVIGVADTDIPNAEHEAEAVAALVPAAKCLTGEAATVETFLEEVGEVGLLHLATHARFSPSDPLASGVRLADGWVTARDIASLDLKGTTIVLSACETGRSGVVGGENLGLIRAFFASGASSLVATHWPVRDVVAAEIIAGAYKAWYTHPGASLAPRLREAMRDVARKRPHPADWAPYFAVGL